MAGPFHSLRAMQALHLKISRKVDAREARERRRESGGRGERNESLQWSLINFHFHPGNPETLQSVKPQTCRRLEKWQVEFIYLFIKSHSQQLSTASKQCFWPLICFFFIHWTSNFKMSARITTQYFDSRFFHIWKDVHIPRLSSPSQSTLYICPLNQKKACPWTWLSHVLLQLLPALSVLLFDGQLLILRQLRCHLHVSEFFYAVEFNRAKKPTLEGSVWTGRLNLSSLSLISFSELNKTLDTN